MLKNPDEQSFILDAVKNIVNPRSTLPRSPPLTKLDMLNPKISFQKHDNFEHFVPLCDSSTSCAFSLVVSETILSRFARNIQETCRGTVWRGEKSKRDDVRENAGNRIHHAQKLHFPLSLNKHTENTPHPPIASHRELRVRKTFGSF